MSQKTSKTAKISNKPRKKIKIFTKKKKRNEPENVFIKRLQEKYAEFDASNVQTFADLPLSPKTLKGLKDCEYVKPTDIQKETIGLALQGKDILGAAQTGSGKTLAFLIPILETLFCKQWTRLDGVGALVITPTRELAYQIFETLRKIGVHHDFSAGLIIGGKDLKFERNRMDQCNIVVCTPGRLLQHMDENPLFDCVNMQILVLDEADRCLDMGFEQTMNAIIANLPPKRQTLLFSATQTKSVKDLARLSLKDASYVSVHEHSEYSTPSALQQSYVICDLQDKVAIIWSFIKNHLKQKCIVFFSSCKQVKYMYEIFCKLRPGTSLLALYGSLHQLRRMEIYESFCRKQSAILFATDLAARGLDFPEVHWVVQADCPEDAATYIHRVGRTARFHRGGESLLLLLRNEEAMVDELKQRKIPIERIEINPMKLRNPVRKIEAYLASTPSLKDTAQRAFVAYAKSVYLMKNKNVFNVHELDTDAYSRSLGLAIPPRIRFLQRMKSRTAAPKPKDIPQENKRIVFDDDDDDDKVSNAPKSKFDVDSDSDDGVLQVKRKDHEIELPTEKELIELNIGRGKKKKATTKAAIARKMLHKNIVPNKKITFDDEGDAVVQATKEKRSEMAQKYENEDEGGIDIETAKMVLREEDKFDKQLFKEKVKAMHKENKKKLKRKIEDEDERDDFGSESDDEPDTSWLPDPDKIYGKVRNSDDDSEESVRIKPINSIKPVRKEKSKTVNDGKVKRKRKKLEDLSASLSVNEAEMLAMMLMEKK